jgi:hypothetical protein
MPSLKNKKPAASRLGSKHSERAEAIASRRSNSTSQARASSSAGTPRRSSPRKGTSDPPSPSVAAAEISSSARRSSRHARQGTIDDTEHSLPASLPNKTTTTVSGNAPSKKGKHYETPELGRGYARGRARHLPQNLDDIVEEEQPPSAGVAAAASTLVYTKAYGASVDHNEEQMDNHEEEQMEDDEDDDQSEGADLSDADYSLVDFRSVMRILLHLMLIQKTRQ